MYSKEAKAEVPTKVEMLVDLLGQAIIIGVIKQTVDKTVKNDAGVYVPNGETREEKHFSPGSASFDIPLEGLKGFKTCKVLPERMFDFHGSPTSRLEIYCYTTSGDAVMSQAIASSKIGADVTRFQLLARPVSIHTGAEETNINSSGYREFMMYCK